MQIPLELNLRVKASLDAFVDTDNPQIVEALQELLHSPGHGFIYLWGKPDTGKTHLLAGACELAEQQAPWVTARCL